MRRGLNSIPFRFHHLGIKFIKLYWYGCIFNCFSLVFSYHSRLVVIIKSMFISKRAFLRNNLQNMVPQDPSLTNLKRRTYKMPDTKARQLWRDQRSRWSPRICRHQVRVPPCKQYNKMSTLWVNSQMIHNDMVQNSRTNLSIIRERCLMNSFGKFTTHKWLQKIIVILSGIDQTKKKTL